MKRHTPGGVGGGLGQGMSSMAADGRSNDTVVAAASTATTAGPKVTYPVSSLLSHSSACNSSPNNVVVLVPPSHNNNDDDGGDGDQNDCEIVYASHLSLNVMQKKKIQIQTTSTDGGDDTPSSSATISSTAVAEEHVWSTQQTLRTATQSTYLEAKQASNTTASVRNVNTVTAERVITCVRQIQVYKDDSTNINRSTSGTNTTGVKSNGPTDNQYDVIVVGFSDGSLTSWIRTRTKAAQAKSKTNAVSQQWEEHVLIEPGSNNNNNNVDGNDTMAQHASTRSITDVDGYASLVIQPHDPNDVDDEFMMMCPTTSLLARLPPGVLQNRGISLSNLCIDCRLSKTLLVLKLVLCNSGGAYNFDIQLDVSPTSFGGIAAPNSSSTTTETHVNNNFRRVVSTPTNVVKYRPFFADNIGDEIDDGSDKSKIKNARRKPHHTGGIFLVGTATPKHNKIHVLTVSLSKSSETDSDTPVTLSAQPPTHVGSLIGHEDWITCFDWFTPLSVFISPLVSAGSASSPTSLFLASGSNDAKIRLWKWVTTTTTTATNAKGGLLDSNAAPENNDYEDGGGDNGDLSDVDDDDEDDDEEMIEGEARLEFNHVSTTNCGTRTSKESTDCPSSSTTVSKQVSVYLEALLIGHEDKVTSVSWHPCPHDSYNRELLLVSASMDRTIFLWCEHEESGVWTPITRVGSAGGILGGSIGSSLLGYLNVKIDPVRGAWIVGAAYGGALHFFSCEDQMMDHSGSNAATASSLDDRVALTQWRAQPCVTGHFAEVNDLCWEASSGMYLLTAGNDQTCRLWAPLASRGVPDADSAWVEIARPQVHGYKLTAVTSLSTKSHKHLLVTGADEKEIRVFDGTLSFIRQLRLLSTGLDQQADTQDEDENVISNRVERAYVPALGLSNKASATDGAEEDTGGASTSISLLPLERDLGSTSLWPEIRKLFGHTTEIARLTSTLESRTALYMNYGGSFENDILVASSARARDVESASIRIWDVNRTRCLQNLRGGHRSTVSAMCFSPDGEYLATSGKDRRLCLWGRGSAVDAQPSHPTTEGMNDSDGLFSLTSAVDVSHKRIVWSIHFCPYDPSILVSGSRDGTVKLWKITEAETDASDGGPTLMEYAKFVPKPDRSSTGGAKAVAVTSLAFAPIQLSDHKEKGLLAIGFENGLVQLWKVPLGPVTETSEAEVAATTPKPRLYLSFREQICHLGAVNKMAFRPILNRSTKRVVLASCSEDHGCRIFEVQVGPDDRPT